MTEFDTEAYLKRIGLAAAPTPSVDGLRSLQRAQPLAIPFENFDILLGRGISLDPATIFDKLVRRPRGGYCFEVNSLFLAALQAFGFEARALLGRVHIAGPVGGRTHQLSLVRIGGEDWIADVGFGSGTALAPMRLSLDVEQDLNGSVRRYVANDVYGIILQMRGEEGWSNLYSFDMGHVIDSDRVLGNHFTSTHPASFFTWARVATRPTPDGRVSLMDYTLRKVAGGQETVTCLEEGEPYLAALRENFGIDLGVRYEEIKPIAGQGADFTV
ncbi:arylamine N-acetyltransferase [Emcibacter sp. SYSU 3D8]|uniref:arylamine N-acetyltransferase family protein n=1 Tax=Emcibacter sp. SYSU 3D8 TaxID=3133969 RepID=UPI0031FF0CC6